MRRLLIIFFLLISQSLLAQHCPWDCSGMILVRTDITATEFNKLAPVLVDQDKRIVVDTIYGTGLDTYDTCRLMYYDDFLLYRSNKIQTHSWYGFDTVYHFAKDHYLLRFNYCRFDSDSDKLFLRYNIPSGPAGAYQYLEIPAEKRIHLHEHSRLLNDRSYNAILNAIQSQILVPGRSDWGLPTTSLTPQGAGNNNQPK